MVLGSIVAALLLVQQTEAAPPKRIGFTVPKATWMIGVPAETFEVSQLKLNPDGTAGYFMLTKGTAGDGPNGGEVPRETTV